MHCISKTNRIPIEIHFYEDTISINGKEYFINSISKKDLQELCDLVIAHSYERFHQFDMDSNCDSRSERYYLIQRKYY